MTNNPVGVVDLFEIVDVSARAIEVDDADAIIVGVHEVEGENRAELAETIEHTEDLGDLETKLYRLPHKYN